MKLKTKIKLILVVDFLAVVFSSLLIKNFEISLSVLLAVFVVWLFIEKKDINERLYENLLALSLGFIEGILIFLGIVYNKVFLNIVEGIFTIIVLMVILVLFPKYKLIFDVFDEFVENLQQKSGFLTLVSFFGLFITVDVFLSILDANYQKEFFINALDFIGKIGFVVCSNLLILQIYTFKKFL